MPAGRAAAQGWSAYGGANNAGWTDPWTQTADPWTLQNASWRNQDGCNWWDDAAPLSHPPGVVPAAASEQWADRADAQDDRLLEEAERFKSYEAIRAEELIWLADNLHQPKGKLAVITDVTEPEVPEID